MFLRSLLIPLFLCISLAACDSAEEKAQAHYERGLELLASGDNDRAKLEFRNALKEVNTYIEPRLELARLNRQEGALRAAYGDYLRIAEQMPDNTEARIALGEMAFLGKDWKNFESNTEAAVGLAPGDPAVKILSLAARYRSAVMDKDDAGRAAVLIEAKAEETNVPDSQILRQVLIDGALQEGNYTEALRLVEKAIADTPDQIDLYKLKLQLLARFEDKDGIEAELLRMVERFPADEDVRSDYLRFLVAIGKIDEAEAFLRAQVAAAPEGDTTAFVTLVQLQLQLRDAKTALAELDRAIEANPKAYKLQALRASIKFDSGERDTAIADMQAIVDTPDSGLTDRDMENIKVALAAMLLRSGNEVGARRLVEEILKANAESVGALKMQARWMIQSDDTEGAINAMRTALANSDQDFEAMTIMAEAYQRAGQSDLMMDFLSLAAEASGNAPEQTLRYAAALRDQKKLLPAEGALIASLRLQPGNVDVLSALGRIYLDLDDLPRAHQVAETLGTIDDDKARQSAEGIKLELLSRESGSDQALAYLDNLASSNSDDEGLKVAQIRARLANGETDIALGLTDELIAAHPDNPTYPYFKGLALATKGDLEAARKVFSDLTETAPNIPEAWTQLARLQTADSTPETVLETLDKGLAANPTSGDLLWAKASFLQGQGDIDGAIAIYEELYAGNSASMVVANNLASLLATYRSDEESLARAQVIARRLQGTEIPALQDTYGWILQRTGKSEEALGYLEPAAAALPEDASVQYHLGVTYEALGRPKEALVQMQRALEKIGPLGSDALADEIRARMTALEAAAN